jgi:hypothetical protein
LEYMLRWSDALRTAGCDGDDADDADADADDAMPSGTAGGSAAETAEAAGVVMVAVASGFAAVLFFLRRNIGLLDGREAAPPRSSEQAQASITMRVRYRPRPGIKLGRLPFHTRDAGR